MSNNISSPTEATTLRLPSFIDERRLSPFQISTVILCFFVMFFDGFDTQAINYMAPAIAEDWGIERGALSAIFSSALVGLLIGYLVLAPISTKLGHKKVLFVGIVVFSIATLVSVWVQNLDQLLVMRFITGIGLGTATPSAIALTAEYSPKRFRASFVLAIYCGFSLGFVVANYAANSLIPAFGWRSVFFVGAIMPLVLLAFVARWMPESAMYLLRRGDETRAHMLLRRIDRSLPATNGPRIEVERAESAAKAKLSALFTGGNLRGTILLWLVFALNLAMFYGLQSWLPTILSEHGYSSTTLATAASMTTIGGIAVAFIVGPSMDRIGAFGSLGMLYLIGFVFLVVMSFSLGAPLGILLTVIFLIGCSVSGGQKSVIALATVFYPEELRSTGVGWALGVGRTGGILGPIAVGAMLTAGWSHQQLFLTLAIPSVVCGLIVLYLGSRSRKLARESNRTKNIERPKL